MGLEVQIEPGCQTVHHRCSCRCELDRNGEVHELLNLDGVEVEELWLTWR